MLKTTGFALGTVKEIYPNRADHPTTTKNIHATTYNMDDSKVNESKIEKSKIENNRLGTWYSELSFTLPDVKTGSVLDYEYDITGPMHTVLPMWEFKNKLPKEYSGYEIIAPKELSFNLPANKLTSINSSSSEENGLKHTIWEKYSIPVLKPEPFVNNLDNFKQTLVIAIGKEYDSKETDHEWETLNKELLFQGNFGQLIAASDNKRIQVVVDSIIRYDITPLAKAKHIFNYARLNFDYNNNEGIYARRSIDQIFGNRIASEAEINLVMTAMMRMAKLDAAPVILSKLNTPQPSPFLPVAQQFNYTVCVVKIDTTSYFLDGSNFFNAFGMLPIFCYNGYARIINKDGNSVVLSASDFKDKSAQQITISHITDSTFIAEITERKGRIEGSYLRNIIGGQDTTMYEKYIKKRALPFPGKATIINGEAKNLFDPEKDLVLKYTVKINRANSNDLYIPTHILKFFSALPFRTSERVLPVEFPSKYEYTYTLSIQIPDGMYSHYDKEPDLGDIIINGIVVSHDLAYDTTKRMLTQKTTLAIHKTTFQPEDYGAIKYFFERMIKDESGFIAINRKIK